MRRTTLLLLTAGVLALVLAVAVAFVADAVLAAPRTVRAGQLAWEGGSEPQAGGLADRAAAYLLGSERNTRFAHIAELYENTPPAQSGDAAATIGSLLVRLPSPAQRAQALTMQGVLLMRSTNVMLNSRYPLDTSSTPGLVRLFQASERSFEQAIRADPSSEPAKLDLEVILRQLQAQRIVIPRAKAWVGPSGPSAGLMLPVIASRRAKQGAADNLAQPTEAGY